MRHKKLKERFLNYHFQKSITIHLFFYDNGDYENDFHEHEEKILYHYLQEFLAVSLYVIK